MKICIVGSSGAGKTTLAQTLAQRHSVTAYAYDDIYWNMAHTVYVKNDQAVMDAKMSEVRAQPAWIVEGAYDKRLRPFFDECTVILRLKVPYWRCAVHILKRFLQRRWSGFIPQETWGNTVELLRFAQQFEARLDHFFQAHPEYAAKVVVVNSHRAGMAYIRQHAAPD